MLQIVIDSLETLKLDYSSFEIQKNYFNRELISITLICSLPNKIGELTIWNNLSRVKQWIDYQTEKIIFLERKEFDSLENLINDLYLFIKECCQTNQI